MPENKPWPSSRSAANLLGKNAIPNGAGSAYYNNGPNVGGNQFTDPSTIQAIANMMDQEGQSNPTQCTPVQHNMSNGDIKVDRGNIKINHDGRSRTQVIQKNSASELRNLLDQGYEVIT